MSSEVLPVEYVKWESAVQGSNGACLCSAESARNVAHVLSTAVVRSPQKKLLSLVRPYIAKLLSCDAGVSILTSLVEFGTPRTVGVLSSELASQQPSVWSFQAEPDASKTDAYGKLLERLVYRKDGSGAAHASMMKQLMQVKLDVLFSSSFLVRAAARMMLVSERFRAKVAQSAAAREAVRASIQSAKLRPHIEACFSMLLRYDGGSASDGSEDEANACVSRFLWGCIEADMTDTASTRPRAGVLLLFASHAELAVATQMARKMSKWRALDQEARRESMAKTIAVLLERLEDESLGCRLIEGVFRTEKDVDACLSTAKTASVHLLAAVGSRPAYTAKLNAKVKAAQDKKVIAARARFRGATMPKAVATQSAIMERISQLRAARVSGSKHPRS